MKKILMMVVGFFLTVPNAHAQITVQLPRNAAVPAGQRTLDPALFRVGALGPIKVVSGVFHDIYRSIGFSSSSNQSHLSGDEFSFNAMGSADTRNVSGSVYFYVTVADAQNSVGIDIQVPWEGCLTGAVSGCGYLPVEKTIGGCIDTWSGSGERRCSASLYINSIPYGPSGMKWVSLPRGRYTVNVRYRDGSRKQSIVNVSEASGPFGGSTF